MERTTSLRDLGAEAFAAHCQRPRRNGIPRLASQQNVCGAMASVSRLAARFDGLRGPALLPIPLLTHRSVEFGEIIADRLHACLGEYLPDHLLPESQHHYSQTASDEIVKFTNIVKHP